MIRYGELDATPRKSTIVSSLSLPKRYKDLTLSSMGVGTYTDNDLAVCAAYTDEWNDYRSRSQHPTKVGIGLRLAGEDRTTLAAATVGTIKEKYPGTFVSWLSAPYLAALYQRKWDSQNKFDADFEEAYSDLQYVESVAELLVIDGLGTERATASDYFSGEFYRLVLSRFDRGRPTIITQYGTLKQYPENIASLLREAFWLIAPGRVVAPSKAATKGASHGAGPS